MDKFVINGPRKLKGQIKVEGSKNAALPIIVGSLLISKGETTIRNVPPLKDIDTIAKVMEHLGAKTTYDPKGQVMTVNAETIARNMAPYELMRQMRAYCPFPSQGMQGPLPARMQRPRPG